MVELTCRELAGMTAVVTGSSSGIGRAIAIELAVAGAACIVHGRRNQAGAEQVAAEIQQSGAAATVLLADLSSPDECDRLVEEAWQWKRGIDIWVNNAGADVLTSETRPLGFAEKLELLWDVDVRGTLLLSRAVGAKMKARGHGILINIGWDQAEHGMAGDSGELFAATKGAVMAFTRSLAQSLAPEVRVNCVAPGWIKTAWGERASDYWQQRAKRESLRGRWGTPEDVAHAIRFLASPAADFITGQVIAVNGGFQHTQ